MRFKRVTLPDGNVIIDTGLPQRNIKPVGLNDLLQMKQTLYTAVADKDGRNFENRTIYNLSKGLVASIYDMSKRDAVREDIYAEIAEALGEDGGASMDAPGRNRIEGEIWLERAIEGLTEHIDSAFGITHRLAIGTFGTASDEEELPEADAVEGSMDVDAGMEGEWKDVDTTT